MSLDIPSPEAMASATDWGAMAAAIPLEAKHDAEMVRERAMAIRMDELEAPKRTTAEQVQASLVHDSLVLVLRGHLLPKAGRASSPDC